MNYEEDLEYLRKEFKKSEDKFREAEREGYETDADIWQNDMVNIGHQIHIHERAAKASEYEAKAKAFDEIIEEYDEIMKEVRNRRFKHVTLLGIKVEKMIKKYKRGELE